jgi:uncharacterized membrane protein
MPATFFYWWATGISADGSVVVGSNDQYRPVRWTLATGAVAQGTVAGFELYSGAQAVSGDGQILVGVAGGDSNTMCFSNCPGFPSQPRHETTAFRQAGPGQNLNRRTPLAGYGSSFARGISGDGTVIVGESLNYVCNVCGGSLVGSRAACMWIGGGPPISLGALPGVSLSTARAASADGSVVVGTDSARAFRWTAAGGMVDVGAFYSGDSARAVSADGSVVVGQDGALGAFIWDAGRGVRGVRNVLQNELGLNMSGWMLAVAVGVSADGRTIVGNGTNPSGQQEAWIAFLGEPVSICYANCDGSTAAPVLNVNDFSCFLNRFAGGDPYANCDASTAAPVLNVNDFTCFLNAFAAGCG